MKLAEALSIRADLQARIENLKSRLKDSSKVQEGDQPAEDVNALWDELEDYLAQLQDITYRINRTNMLTEHEGEPLTRMIARKDTLKLRLDVMRDVLKHITQFDRYGRLEIKYVRVTNVGELRKTMDGYSKKLRSLDLKLQSLNWSIDLI